MCRAALRALLEASEGLEVVGEAAQSSDTPGTTKQLNPDMVLLDVDGQEWSAIKIVRQIRQECPDVRIMVLSAKPDRQTLFEFSQAGANGVVTKDLKVSVFLTALRTVVQSGVYVSPSASGLVLDDYLRRARGNNPTSDWSYY